MVSLIYCIFPSLEGPFESFIFSISLLISPHPFLYCLEHIYNSCLRISVGQCHHLSHFWNCSIDFFFPLITDHILLLIIPMLDWMLDIVDFVLLDARCSALLLNSIRFCSGAHLRYLTVVGFFQSLLFLG